MRSTTALVMFLALPYAYAGPDEEDLFDKIELRKDANRRDADSLARIAFLAKRADLTAHNTHEETGLLLAAANGDAAVVDVLLKEKADPEARNLSEQTALLAAVANRHYALAMTLILEHHVDTWARDYEGKSAAAIIRESLNSLTGAAKEDAVLLLEVLNAPRVLPPCTTPPVAHPTVLASCFNWLTPIRAAGVVAVAVMAVVVSRSSSDGPQ